MDCMSGLNILYDSECYCLAEYAGRRGLELVDKLACRSAYLEGLVASKLRAAVAYASEIDCSDETVDTMLAYYDALLIAPATPH